MSLPLPGPENVLGDAPGRLRVLIVGGGASGVLLAAQLLRRGAARVSVRMVEKGEALGCGVAYGTRDPAHLLNTRVANMSAYPHLPDHFLDWLRRAEPSLADPQGFVPRETYGRYVRSLLDGWQGRPGLECRRGECVALRVGKTGVMARLASGEAVEADVVVLATGHVLPRADTPAPLVEQPWLGETAAPERVAPDDAVLIVGSGLSMVDQTASLLDGGHRGLIVAVSRRGLLPQVHAPTEALCWKAEDLPSPASVAGLMRWLRAQARAREAEGGTWRDAVDGLRPHMQAIWQGMPEAARRSFLRHASAHWDIHRHRMPPASARRIGEAVAAGRLRLARAGFEGAEREGGRLKAHLRGPDGLPSILVVDQIVDCRGPRRGPAAQAAPMVAGLIAQGEARVDALAIGLDVGPNCGLVRRDGTVSDRVFAMGPASRAAFWEITAIPDIRAQAAMLAARLLEGRPG